MAVRILCFALGIVSVGLTLNAGAQHDWPSRPIKFIVPTSPGGGTDLYARTLAPALAELLKQPVAVENRPGAGGNIGAELVARAAPDGYTFLVSASGTMVVNPALYATLPFDAERHFVPVARGVTGPFAFVSHAALPAKNLRELIAAARSRPGEVSFGSAGAGSVSYLAVRMLEEAAGVRFLHVPYKGLGQAYQDLLGGQLHFLYSDIGLALPHIKAGRMHALAVTARTALIPQAETMGDAGFNDVRADNFFSVYAPAGTSVTIVNQLNAAIAAAMRSPALAERLEAQGWVPVFESPEQFSASLKRERQSWAAFIRRNGIKPEQ
ncbi:MAG TPA: tripartite tricarboxylate transporter substrate binding protein [Methyloceanibacter sp.]|nr:tripartite tricarboxylate transporter substrate binding protein [Methyloceanibacter sp.]